MCGAAWLLVSFRVRDRNIFVSDSSSESPRPPWWFFVASKHSSRLGVFAKTESLTLAGVNSLVLVCRKRDQVKTKSSSAVGQNFFSLPVRAHHCGTVSSFAHWKLVSYRFLALLSAPAMLPVFLRSFANALMLYFASVKAGSKITENGLLSGSDGRKLSDLFTNKLLLTDSVILLPRISAKPLPKNILFFFWHFLYRSVTLR